MDDMLLLLGTALVGLAVAVLSIAGREWFARWLGYIEDDELIAVLYRHRAELKARLEGTPNEVLQPTGAAILVLRDMQLFKAAPAAELFRSRGKGPGGCTRTGCRRE